MRERYAEVFDHIWIDNLHGDRMMSEYAPDGRTSETMFAMEGTSAGIRIGTAISLLVRKQSHSDSEPCHILYRDFTDAKAVDRRAAMLESLSESHSGYKALVPVVEAGLPLKPQEVNDAYRSWLDLPDLFSVSYTGVNTSRDADLIAIDEAKLQERMQHYFNPALSDEQVHQHVPSIMTSSSRYNAETARNQLLGRGINTGHFVRYCYRPFDERTSYWHPETKLLDEKREDLFSAFKAGNLFLTSRQKAERQNEGTPFYVTSSLIDRHLTRPGSACFPLTRNGYHKTQNTLFADTEEAAHPKANLSEKARQYLASLGIDDPDADEDTASLLWMHALAIGYSPAYLTENADGIRGDWPRIPLPETLEALEASAKLGREVAALLDTETAVPGVTTGTIRPELRLLGPIRKADGGQIQPQAGDLRVAAGWGHAGQGGVTMPGKGKAIARAWADAERQALADGAAARDLTAEQATACLGETTYSVYLNGGAYWGHVPARVWEYTIGGYQVLKKWLSYREHTLLGRDLTPEEARYVTQAVRRLAALRLMEPALDGNYGAVK